MTTENREPVMRPDRWSNLRRHLGRPYMLVMPVILGAAFTLPSLRVGWIVDDHWHRLSLTGKQDLFEPGVVQSSSPMKLFSFLDGDPKRNRRLIDAGVMPWWTDEGIRGAFARPLTAWTHVLDYRGWPDHAMLMHVHSVLWYGVLVAVVAALYRRMFGGGPSPFPHGEGRSPPRPCTACGNGDGPLLAAVAALLFAVDDAHGTPVGFLANRSTLIAGVFGVGAIIAHDRWRRDGWRPGVFVGPVLLALSLSAKESGVATVAYLLSHAVFIDRSQWSARCRALAPYVAVVAVWRVVWSAMGYGIMPGVDFYIDPAAEPLRFARAMLERAPLLLMGQWGLSSDVALPVRTMLPDAYRWVCAGSAALVAMVGVVVVPRIRHDRVARFWLMGMLFALVPACAAFPADRLLMFVGIGAMGVLARFFAAVMDGTNPPARRVFRAVGWVVCACLVLRHVAVAPAALAWRSANPLGPRAFMKQFHVNTPMDESVTHQSVVIVTAPVAMLAGQLAAIRATEGKPVPKHTRVLSPSGATVTIRRADAHTLVIRPDGGYLAWMMDQLFRSPHHPFTLGERIELTGVTITILAMNDDDRPAEVEFRFTVPLEDATLRWLRWDDPTRSFVPFTPPAIGRSERLHGGGI